MPRMIFLCPVLRLSCDTDRARLRLIRHASAHACAQCGTGVLSYGCLPIIYIYNCSASKQGARVRTKKHTANQCRTSATSDSRILRTRSTYWRLPSHPHTCTCNPFCRGIRKLESYATLPLRVRRAQLTLSFRFVRTLVGLDAICMEITSSRPFLGAAQREQGPELLQPLGGYGKEPSVLHILLLRLEVD